MTYVRNAWYVAAWSQELADDKPFAISILSEPIVIYRTASGGIAALEDRCVHRMAPLSHGRCEGNNLRCMYHGMLFNAGGTVIEIPGQDMIPPQARVKSYPVAEKHDWIWVWMGDAAAADEALIPPAVGLSDPGWILGHGQMDYAAEARLINDNLCDFTHLSYVHANSFGSSETWAKSRPKITAIDRGLRFERWIEDEPSLGSNGERGQRDAWSSYDFLVPGILLMSSGAYPTGTAKACNMGPPDPSLPSESVTFTSQAVTPMGDKSSRYFFSWGPRVDQGDAAMRDMLMGIADMAFTEDRIIIEAQQRVIDASPGRNIMPTTGDKGVTMFNGLVDKMAKEER
jgi:phenylpropionate dioxygenase-like ring-hydroxylating dioxygenase large terminal subunit